MPLQVRGWPGGLVVPLAALGGSMLPVAAFMVFVWSPPDDLQGEVQRIFYLHVPSAIAAYTCFAMVFGGGLAYLWRGLAGADRLARAAAPVGLVFTSVTLVMGSLWAKPIWGTFWTWDARLTSTLVLWLVYGGYLLVRRMSVPGRQAARLGAIVGIFGFLDVPIVHFSVVWWRTQHPALEAASRSNMDSRMWVTFMVSLVTVVLVSGALVALSYEVERLREELAPKEES